MHLVANDVKRQPSAATRPPTTAVNRVDLRLVIILIIVIMMITIVMTMVMSCHPLRNMPQKGKRPILAYVGDKLQPPQTLMPPPHLKTLQKAQRTRGLSSSCQSNFLKSYHKLKQKSRSQSIFRISTKHQQKILTKHQHLH